MAWQDVRSFYEEQDDPDPPRVKWVCPTPDCRTQTSELVGVTPELCDQCGAAFQVKTDLDDLVDWTCPKCGGSGGGDEPHLTCSCCGGCGVKAPPMSNPKWEEPLEGF